MGTTSRPGTTGVRQFLDLDQQRAWIEGRAELPDAGERSESLEHRFKYAARFETPAACRAADVAALERELARYGGAPVHEEL